jgi:hypothetical protein
MKRTAAEQLAWAGPGVQGVCGAVVGALVGLGAWAELLEGNWGWAAIPAGAVLFGALAAVYGDHFWERWLGYWDWR